MREDTNDTSIRRGVWIHTDYLILEISVKGKLVCQSRTITWTRMHTRVMALG